MYTYSFVSLRALVENPHCGAEAHPPSPRTASKQIIPIADPSDNLSCGPEVSHELLASFGFLTQTGCPPLLAEQDPLLAEGLDLRS